MDPHKPRKPRKPWRLKQFPRPYPLVLPINPSYRHRLQLSHFLTHNLQLTTSLTTLRHHLEPCNLEPFRVCSGVEWVCSQLSIYECLGFCWRVGMGPASDP